MDNDTLELWYAYPNEALSDEAEQSCRSLLSGDELARMQAFRFDRLRREYLTTRVLVRSALSHNCAISPDAWRFRRNSWGKPRTEPDCGLRFNLSNCPGLAVCLLANGAEVGVDAEPHDRAKQIAELAESVCSARELARLETLGEAERLDSALSLWTLKEAYIKARGMGLSLPLKRISFLMGGVEGIRLEEDPCVDDRADRWRFCLLEHARHRIALVAERDSAPHLHLWEMRPMMAQPVRLADAGEQWSPFSRESP